MPTVKTVVPPVFKAFAAAIAPLATLLSNSVPLVGVPSVKRMTTDFLVLSSPVRPFRTSFACSIPKFACVAPSAVRLLTAVFSSPLPVLAFVKPLTVLASLGNVTRLMRLSIVLPSLSFCVATLSIKSPDCRFQCFNPVLVLDSICFNPFV